MLVTYSAMNSSTDENSWLIVTRSSRGTSFLGGFIRTFLDGGVRRLVAVLLLVPGALVAGALLRLGFALLRLLLAHDLIVLEVERAPRLDHDALLQPLLQHLDVLEVARLQELGD